MNQIGGVILGRTTAANAGDCTYAGAVDHASPIRTAVFLILLLGTALLKRRRRLWGSRRVSLPYLRRRASRLARPAPATISQTRSSNSSHSGR